MITTKSNRSSQAFVKGAALLAGLGTVVAACSSDPSSTRLQATGIVAPVTTAGAGNRVLLDEFVGHFDAATGTLTITPIDAPRPDLGLTGKSEAWKTGTHNINVTTVGATYQNRSGTVSSQGTAPTCAVSNAGNCGSGSQTCNAATCGTIALSTVSGTYDSVDITVVTIQNAIVEGGNTIPTGTTEASTVTPTSNGVWRFTSTVTTTPQNMPTTWQFDTATSGQSFTFGIAAWGEYPSTVNLGWSTSSINLGSVSQGTSATSSVDTLTNSGTTSTGVLTSTSSSASGVGTITASTDHCTGATLGASGTCTTAYTLTCPADQSGYTSATFTYTDPTSGQTPTVTVAGTCVGALSFSPNPEDLATVAQGSVGTGTPITMTNEQSTTTGALSYTSSSTWTGGTAITLPSGVDSCTGAAIASEGTCQVTPQIFCSSSTPSSVTTTFVFTDPSSSVTSSLVVTGTCEALTVDPEPSNLCGNNYIGVANKCEADGLTTIANEGSTTSGILKRSPTSGTTGVFSLPSTYASDTCSGEALAGGTTCNVIPTVTCKNTDDGSTTKSYSYTDQTSGVAVTASFNTICSPFFSTMGSSATFDNSYAFGTVGSGTTAGAAFKITDANKTINITDTNVTVTKGGNTSAILWNNACSGVTLTANSANSCNITPSIDCTSTSGTVSGTITLTDSAHSGLITLTATGTCP